MLESLESSETEALRQRLEAGGYAFEFSLCRATGEVEQQEAAHHQVLASLFEGIDRRWKKHRADVIAERPEYASLDWFELTTNLGAACPRKLSENEVFELTKADGALASAFLMPPYSTTLKVADFSEWLAMLRLLPGEDVEVFDWVGNPDHEPERSDWSNYFDAGKEWWGIWCMTVYNPRRGTLCALVASTTD